MAVVINGTTGITSVNGSAAAPSVTGTDTDTGIVYGTNTLSLATGGTTAMTIDSSQAATFTGALNLTTVSANHYIGQGTGWVWSSNGTSAGTVRGGVYASSNNVLSLFGGATVGPQVNVSSSGYLGIATQTPAAPLDVAVAGEALRISGSTSTAYLRSVASGVNQWYMGSGGSTGLQLYTYTAEPITLSVNGAESMRAHSNGYVGIKTTTPVVALDVYGSLNLRNGYNLTWGGVYGAGIPTLTADASGGFQFYPSGSTQGERMRLNPTGQLCVGTSTLLNNSRISVLAYANVIAIETKTSADNYYPMFFYNAAGSYVGYIYSTSSTTAYVTSSDYRLKENVQPMQGALATVAQLKPCTYTWKADGSSGQGFIAHELQEFVPEAVTGEKDAVEANGKPKYQGIDTSFLVATLTAAIQEQQALIETLKARLDAANL